MIVEGYTAKEEEEVKVFRKFMDLVTVAVGTSLDAFAVGLSFALLNIMIWEIGIVIGVVTFLASMTAIRIGKAAGSRLGQRVEIVGGLILVAIGIKIFLEHMLA
jgi:putative Mn2+ efflux pump MntP